jgi:hypothetical protein
MTEAVPALTVNAGVMEQNGEVGAYTVAAVDLRFVKAAVAVSVANNDFADVCAEKWGDDPSKWGPNNGDTTNLRMLCRAAWLPTHYTERAPCQWLTNKAAEEDKHPLEVLCTRKIADFPDDVKLYRSAAFKAADRVFDLQLAEAKIHHESMRVFLSYTSFFFFSVVCYNFLRLPTAKSIGRICFDFLSVFLLRSN